jgi:hypothetical protein
LAPAQNALPLRSQHHGAAFHVLVEGVERVGDLADQCEIEEVQRRRCSKVA